MEMVKTEVIVLALSALFLSACCPGTSWEKFNMDGHRTGVTNVDNGTLQETLGTVENGVYTAPNGKVFEGGATAAAAKALIDVQPKMARLKEVLATCTEEMEAERPESALSDWAADVLMEAVADLTHKKVDVGLINVGGIRIAMPRGNVTLGDMEAMFPFKNSLCYVALKGSDLKANIFDVMATSGKVEGLGGVKLAIEDGAIKELLIGGEPLDPEKVYGVATIDFLLDGGDNYSVAKNAKELIITKDLIGKAMTSRVRRYGEENKPIEYQTDGRVSIVTK